ncbi:unnamed protein product [Cylicostephanus goldi]|uniref:Uncharacterized protein n=1 Tax=Cylicostephanus goldi TaxID=71465 RepID=A0A3P7MM90_CYLGO|nr:unnamed protein product [Cylicostephanus goldi]
MELALRKARGPKVRKSIPVEESDKLTASEDGDTMLAEELLPVTPQAASVTIIEHDDESLTAINASTPGSLELNIMQNFISNAYPTNTRGKYVMKRAPRFPVRKDDIAAIRHTFSPAPIIMERIDQSTVFPEEESAEKNYPTALEKGDTYRTWKKRSWLWSILKFYTTTKAKFVLHVLFRVIYVFLYSWVLVAKPRQRSTLPQLSNYWPEMIVALVQLSQLCDSVAAIRERGFLDWTSDHMFGFHRNLTIIVNFVLFATIILRASFTEGEVM